MSPTDQVQELFDRAIASVSHAHHFQLTRCTLASISDGFELGYQRLARVCLRLP